MRPIRADLTIVTLCKDNPSELLATIDSIVGQNLLPRKSVVIDGSAENLRSKMLEISEKAGSVYCWQPSDGIYAAMRSALDQLGESKYCLFLNSGDRLAGPSVLETFSEFVLAEINRDAVWVIGEMEIAREGKTEAIFKVPEGQVSFAAKIRSGDFTLPHPATFYRVDDFLQVNPFADPYKISADYSTGLRLFQLHGAPAVIPHTISIHELGGISSRMIIRGRLENLIARLKILGLVQLPFEVLWLLQFGARVIAKTTRRLLQPKATCSAKNPEFDC